MRLEAGVAEVITSEIRAECFAAGRAAFLRATIGRTVRDRDEAIRFAVNAALLEALPALLEAGADAERDIIVKRARRLNYGPTLRRFIRDVVRGYHRDEAAQASDKEI